MYHNGHGFLYKVSWREAGSRDARWNSAEVKSPPFLVQNAGTYTPFEIKVQAVNSLGSGPEPDPEIGHSGEDGWSRITQNSNMSNIWPVGSVVDSSEGSGQHSRPLLDFNKSRI